MKKIAILAFALMVCAPHAAFAVGDSTSATPIDPARTMSSLAAYNGETIDLAKGWGDAQACYVQDSGTNCFDTEKEMNEFKAATDSPDVSGFKGSARLTACSSDLSLYDAISYGAPVLSLATRFTVLNLSTYGFDNRTTSYRVGACSVSMWQGASATGTLYPGNTSAGAQSPNMVTGWNNTMSSVYIG